MLNVTLLLIVSINYILGILYIPLLCGKSAAPENSAKFREVIDFKPNQIKVGTRKDQYV